MSTISLGLTENGFFLTAASPTIALQTMPLYKSFQRPSPSVTNLQEKSTLSGQASSRTVNAMERHRPTALQNRNSAKTAPPALSQ